MLKKLTDLNGIKNEYAIPNDDFIVVEKKYLNDRSARILINIKKVF